MHKLLPFPALLLLASPAAAQDLIGINFSGTSFVASSFTGTGQQLATNQLRCNSMARKGRDLWVDIATGSTLTPTRSLGRLDEQTGAVTIAFGVSVDIRGLATTNTNGKILGIVNDTPSDRLVQIDINSGVVTNIGSTGFTEIQALTLQSGQFYAWDLTAGLLRVDHLTGVATDVDPNLGTGGADIQFLCSMHDGRMLGGRNQLYEVDPGTGIATPFGGSGFSDLRGAEERFGYIQNFGTPCNGPNGPANLTVTGSIGAPTTLTTRSVGHAQHAPGFLCFGFSNTTAGQLALPLSVDHLLGTHGCHVFQSCDVTVFATADLIGRLTIPFSLPAIVRGGFFYFQHAALDPVPGGWSFSDAALVSLSL